MTTKTNDLGSFIDSFVGQLNPGDILKRLGLERRGSPFLSALRPLAALGVGLAGGAYAEEILVAAGLRPARSRMPSVLAGAGILAAGAILGAVVGVALAPTSGREFRKNLAERVDGLKRQIVSAEEAAVAKLIPKAAAHATAQNQAR